MIGDCRIDERPVPNMVDRFETGSPDQNGSYSRELTYRRLSVLEKLFNAKILIAAVDLFSLILKVEETGDSNVRDVKSYPSLILSLS
jgi:hypothetical protein